MGGDVTMAFSIILLPFLRSAARVTSCHHLPHVRCIQGPNTYARGDAYSESLDQVLDDLVQKAPQNYGFWQSSLGPHGNRSTGVALCRGDITWDDCAVCLSKAKSKLTKDCNSRGAVVWYDKCYLKYHDWYFLGGIDYEKHCEIWNGTYAPDPRSFRMRVKGLINNLIIQAGERTRLFASGSAQKGGNTTIYAMVQCRRDLSKNECSDECLPNLMHFYFPDMSQVGATILNDSCVLRYETYNFLNPDSMY